MKSELSLVEACHKQSDISSDIVSKAWNALETGGHVTKEDYRRLSEALREANAAAVELSERAHGAKPPRVRP